MIGQTISHYRILEKLGRGGMGIVFKAEDLKLGRLVALKFISKDLLRDPRALERFKREARTASALNHPNICTVHEIGEVDEQSFISMEFIKGRTLRAMLAQELSPECVLEVFGQLAKATSVAHAAGIFHRDLKPENVMVRDDGLVKVLDFGLARLTKADPGASTETVECSDRDTLPGTIIGTASYMSPEQIRGEAVYSASDIFSLGIVLYESVTGRHPFFADSQVGVMHSILSDTPLPPSRLKVDTARALDALVLQMLEKDPHLRPVAPEVETALAELAQKDKVLQSRPTGVPVMRRTVGREKELSELQAGLEFMMAGRGLILCVAGEPGIGKTTLIEDFLAEVQSSGPKYRTARGRCSERLAGAEAYLPILEALGSMLQGESGESLARVMKLVAPTWYFQVVPLAAKEPSAARLMADVRAATQRMKRELWAFFEEISRLRPLILFFDDMHWADASTTDILAYVANRLESMRLLMMVSYRPTDLLLAKHPFLNVKLDLQARGICKEIALEFLTRQDIERYLALEFPGHRVSSKVWSVNPRQD
jgi:predicted Ser/Thr protein kinase